MKVVIPATISVLTLVPFLDSLKILSIILFLLFVVGVDNGQEYFNRWQKKPQEGKHFWKLENIEKISGVFVRFCVLEVLLCVSLSPEVVLDEQKLTCYIYKVNEGVASAKCVASQHPGRKVWLAFNRQTHAKL